MFKTNGQFFVFAAFVFCGVVVGLWYSVSHFFDTGCKKTVWLWDLLFGVGLVAGVPLAFFAINGIQLRWFCFLGIFVGVVAYRKILQQPLDKLKLRLYNTFKKTTGILKCKTRKKQKESNLSQ